MLNIINYKKQESNQRLNNAYHGIDGPLKVSDPNYVVKGTDLYIKTMQELGLPFDMKINALLFFNIGVEIGQLIFIGIVLLIAIILRSNPLFSNHYLPFLNQLGIYFIGTISTFWFLQRTFALI